MGMFDTVYVAGLVCGECGRTSVTEQDVQIKPNPEALGADGFPYEPGLRVVRIGGRLDGYPVEEPPSDESGIWGCDYCRGFTWVVVRIEGGVVVSVRAKPPPSIYQRRARAFPATPLRSGYAVCPGEALRRYTEEMAAIYMGTNPFFETYKNAQRRG